MNLRVSLSRPLVFGFLISGVAGFCLADCAAGKGSEKKSPLGSSCVVATATSPFFKHGPSQGNGPDQLLPRGTHLTVTGHKYGYARVTTDAGIAGYVPDHDLAPAPATPAPKIVAASPEPPVQRNGFPSPPEPLPPSPGDSLYDAPVPTLPVEGEKPRAQ